MNVHSDVYQNTIYKGRLAAWWLEQAFETDRILGPNLGDTRKELKEAISERIFWARLEGLYDGILYITSDNLAEIPENISQTVISFIQAHFNFKQETKDLLRIYHSEIQCANGYLSDLPASLERIKRMTDYEAHETRASLRPPAQLVRSHHLLGTTPLMSSSKKLCMSFSFFLGVFFTLGSLVLLRAYRIKKTLELTIPLMLIVFYLLLSYLAFLSGIIIWPDRFSLLQLSTYLLLCSGAISFGYLLGIRKFEVLPERTTFPMIWHLIIISILANLVLAFVYTGKLPTNIFELIADQKDAYNDMLKNLNQVSLAQKIPIVITRALSFPGALSVIPLLLFFRGSLSRGKILLSLSWILSLLFISLVRGTDKELGDLVVLTCAFILIKVVMIQRKQMDISKSHLVKSGLSLALIIAIFFAVFSYRKNQRLGDISGYCVYGLACLNHENAFLNALPSSLRIPFGVFTGYFTQGYFGLGLALDLPFHFTYSTGVLPAVAPHLDRISNLPLSEMRYPERLKSLGWHSHYTWSTALVWFASDISFLGVPFLLLTAAYLLGLTWISAVSNPNIVATVAFSLLFYFFIFLPANNQLFQSWDFIFGFFFFMGLFLASKKKCLKMSCSSLT